MLKQFLKILASVIMTIIILSLSACGFNTSHDQNSLPPQLQKLTLQTNVPYTDFDRHIREALQFAHVQLLSQGQAPYTLQINAVGPQYITPLIMTSSISRVYRITYKVNFWLTDNKNNIVIPQHTINAARDLILAPNQLLETNNQGVTLVTQMQQEVIYRLFNQLNSAESINYLMEYDKKLTKSTSKQHKKRQ